MAEYYPPKDLSLGGESVAINLRIIQRPSHNYPLPPIIEFPDTITYLRAQGMNLLSGSMYIEFRFAHHWISVIFLFQCFSQCPDSVHIVIEGIAGSGRKLGEVATKAFWLYQYLLTSLSEILSLVRLPWLGTPTQVSVMLMTYGRWNTWRRSLAYHPRRRELASQIAVSRPISGIPPTQ